MFKLKLQYFGHLMQRTDSLEKILVLGKIEGGRRGQQKMRWLDKEEVLHIYNGILLGHKKERDNAICSKWMNLEIIIVSQTGKDKYQMMLSGI